MKLTSHLHINPKNVRGKRGSILKSISQDSIEHFFRSNRKLLFLVNNCTTHPKNSSRKIKLIPTNGCINLFPFLKSCIQACQSGGFMCVRSLHHQQCLVFTSFHHIFCTFYLNNVISQHTREIEREQEKKIVEDVPPHLDVIIFHLLYYYSIFCTLSCILNTYVVNIHTQKKILQWFY